MLHQCFKEGMYDKKQNMNKTIFYNKYIFTTISLPFTQKPKVYSLVYAENPLFLLVSEDYRSVQTGHQEP